MLIEILLFVSFQGNLVGMVDYSAFEWKIFRI